MAVNPAGFQLLQDGGFPVTFTGRAIAAVSGGEFVFLGSQANSTSSGLNSFAGPAEIWVNSPASGTNFPCGVATHNAGSNTDVVVLLKGMVMSTFDAGIAPGARLASLNGANAVSSLASGADPVVVTNRKVGWALTGAGSEGYGLVRLDL